MMLKRLVILDSDDDVDVNIGKTKKRLTISTDGDDDDDDDSPCGDVVEFNLYCRKLRLCGFDHVKATEIAKGIFKIPKLTDIAAAPRHPHTILYTVRHPSLTVRVVSFDDGDHFTAPAATSTAVEIAMEDSSEVVHEDVEEPKDSFCKPKENSSHSDIDLVWFLLHLITFFWY